MISRGRNCSTITYPDWFWRLAVELIGDWNKEAVKKRMKTIDMNGSISFDEFCKLFDRLNEEFGDD